MLYDKLFINYNKYMINFLYKREWGVMCMERLNWKKIFGNNLRKLRLQKNLTLEVLAENINSKYNTAINKSMLSKWENGYEARIDSIIPIALYFNVSLDFLLGLESVCYSSENKDKIETSKRTAYSVVWLNSLIEAKLLTSEVKMHILNIVGSLNSDNLF